MTAARGQRTNYGVYFHISIVVGSAPTTDNCSSEPRTDPAERHTLTRALRWKHENDSIRARLPLCTELLCYVQAGGRRCAAHSVLCSGQAVQTFCQYFFCNFATMIQPQVLKGNSQEISFFVFDSMDFFIRSILKSAKFLPLFLFHNHSTHFVYCFLNIFYRFLSLSMNSFMRFFILNSHKGLHATAIKDQ